MKRLCLFIAVIALFNILYASAYAEEASLLANSQNRVTVSLSISNGKATGSAVVFLLNGNSATITVTIQKKNGSQWSSAASNSGQLSTAASVSAEKGATYRAYTVCKVYNSSGQLIETISAYSTEKQY